MGSRVIALLLLTSVSTFGATIPGLFNTGVGTNSVILANGAVDPHYRLVQSPDTNAPGPNTFVVNDTLFPIVGTGPWLPTTSTSKWIGPQSNQSTGNRFGDYTYRIVFDLTGLDSDTAVITGRWATDNEGRDILLNGVSTGNGNSAQFTSWTSFSISADEGDRFLPGTNTLDFILNNADVTVNPTGFRAELSGTTLPPQTPPFILMQPQSTVASLGDAASLTVNARASAPVSYQWRFNGANIGNGTNRTYSISTVSASDAGSYDVVVSNPWGSITSAVATLRTVLRFGPSSRRTGLVFSEIMYHPKTRSDNRNLEFVEIQNTNPYEEDLSGYRITGQWDYTFPSNTFIPGDGFLVIAPVPTDVQTVYGITGVLGGFTNNLANDSGTLRLRKRSGGIVLEVEYSDEPPWPIAADGTGHSLVLARPWFGENNSKAWSHSAVVGGSPGAGDFPAAGPLENVVINEILAHTDDPIPDFIELYNHSTNSVNISGCYLTDDASSNKFRIPNPTILGPRAFISFNQAQLGFALSADGEELFFVNSNQTRVIDAVRFGGQARNTTVGRYPDGVSSLHELMTPTAGAANAALLIRDIVINEIMYNPISGSEDDEYIELHNKSAGAVNVGGWRFLDGIDFALPQGVVVPAGGYLVVAKNAARLTSNYFGLHGGNVVGNFTGRLDDGGEHISIGMPETRFTTNLSNGSVTTNTYYIVADEVTYVDGGRWGTQSGNHSWADGGGSSLELIDPASDNRLAPNWADSDESGKAPWTTIEHTGLLDNGSGTADRLDVLVQGPGESLIDDVEVVPATGGNRVANPGFDAGTANWILQGDHIRSFHDTSEGPSLHLVATERGDHVANHARAMLSSAMTINANGTIRARARWLRGHPEMLLRLKGGYLEAVGRLSVPLNLGTPGARNSRAVSNAGPALTDVRHSPVLPPAGQPFRVLARVHDANGVQLVRASYRLDPSLTRSTTTMNDNGIDADEVAGDGVFTGTIPGQNAGATVAFYVEAVDSASASNRFPKDAPARECLVRVGEISPGGAFGVYRMWMTQLAVNNWINRPIMSNEDIDNTFVYGSSHVVYNAGAHYSGSSYTAGCYNSPVGNSSGYDINLPDDDSLLGATHFTTDFLVRDPTGQREQLQYWLLEQYGLPNMYRRYVHVIVNGVPQNVRGGCLGSNAIYEDLQQPGADAIEEFFPNDSDGDLYKTDCWDEFSDAGVRETSCISLNTLQNFTTPPGVKKVARYRWNWRPRAVDGTVNDFTTLFELVDAANAAAPGYQSAIECIVDVPHWMKTFAMNDLSSFWDAFGNPNGKNTYLYKPEDDGWKLFCWDFDVGLGVFNDPVDAPLFAANDPQVSRMIPSTPVWTRLYWCALDEAMNSFFRVGAGTAIDRLLDAKYAAFVQNGVPLSSPDAIKTWITGRRNFLQSQLNTVMPAFTAVTNSITTGTNLVTLTGVASVTIHSITVNGVAYPITWATVTTWRLTVPITSGTTNLLVEGRDRFGNVVSNTIRNIAVTFTGADPSPEDHIVINEIMYNPLIPEASFVELFNTSSNYTFDISGWRIDGMGFRFPPGTIISNRQFLVVVKNRGAFGAAYGWNIPVICEFDGQLDDGGETLTLLRPGAMANEELVVDQVTYDDDAPWPVAADGQGYSLQLIDSQQDNDRVSNWTDGQGWRFFSVTRTNGSSTATRMSFFFTDPTGGDFYLDDVAFVAGPVPGAGANLLANGDFESMLSPPWMFSALASNSVISTEVAHSGSASLHYIQSPGSAQLTTFYQDMSPVSTGTVYTLSYWFLSGVGNNFRARLTPTYDVTANVRALRSTPGASNGQPATVPPYPLLWLSEVQPSPGPALDNAGEAEPWVELYFGGPSPIFLGAYFLSDDFGNLTKWSFVDVMITNYLLVWADGEVDESTMVDPHTNFRLNPGTGSIVLSRLVNGVPQIVDYLNYRNLATNDSYGTFPPGQSSQRLTFHFPTPGGANDPTRRPVSVFINEWMASNSGAVQDPFDQDFDDWFELYNASAQPVDLSRYKLTDLLTDSNKFTIPDGFVIPARGYLLIWADEEGSQTRTNGDLHVNFRLSAGGEEIGLFEPGPNGRKVDSVEFGSQTPNVSQGRYPDGAPLPYPLMSPFTPRSANRVAVTQPEILSLTVSPSSAMLTWRSQAGRTYRVQYKDVLDGAAWVDVPIDVSATGDSASKTDTTISGVAQRFYRIQLVQ